MKIQIFAASLLVLSTAAMASDVNVSISVGQPDFYGRIDIGNYPPPRLVYSRPVIIERPEYYVEQPPVYLRVPPGHRKHWAKHCREYNACGQRVYFVQDNWYTNEYAPRYREAHGDHHDNHDGERGDGGDYGKHGKGNKHGEGHGHGEGHNKD